MSELNSICVIVPCFNEGKVLRQTVQGLLSKNYLVIVVDDASTDNSREVLQNLPVYYIRHSINLGQGAALCTGLTFASKLAAKYVVTFDADGQHDVEDVGKMLQLLKLENADIVFGSRFLAGSRTNAPFLRKYVLKIARFLNFLASGILLSDANNGIRLMSKKAAELIRITENRSTHSAQIQNQVKIHGIRYIESPVNIVYSKYSKAKGLRNINSLRILYELILFKFFR